MLILVRPLSGLVELSFQRIAGHISELDLLVGVTVIHVNRKTVTPHVVRPEIDVGVA